MDIPQEAIAKLCRLSEEERRHFVYNMGKKDALRLDGMFATWVSDGQKAPGATGAPG